MPTFKRTRSCTPATVARPCLSPPAHHCDWHRAVSRTQPPCPIVAAPSPALPAELAPTRVPIVDCCRQCVAAYEYGLQPDDGYSVRWTKRGAARRQQQLREAATAPSPVVPSSPVDDDADVPLEPYAAALDVDEVAIKRRRHSSSELPAPESLVPAEALHDNDTTGMLRRANSTPVQVESDSDDDAPPLLRRQTLGEQTAFGSMAPPSKPKAKRGRLNWRSLVAIPVPATVRHF